MHLKRYRPAHPRTPAPARSLPGLALASPAPAARGLQCRRLSPRDPPGVSEPGENLRGVGPRPGVPPSRSRGRFSPGPGAAPPGKGGEPGCHAGRVDWLGVRARLPRTGTLGAGKERGAGALPQRTDIEAPELGRRAGSQGRWRRLRGRPGSAARGRPGRGATPDADPALPSGGPAPHSHPDSAPGARGWSCGGRRVLSPSGSSAERTPRAGRGLLRDPHSASAGHSSPPPHPEGLCQGQEPHEAPGERRAQKDDPLHPERSGVQTAEPQRARRPGHPKSLRQSRAKSPPEGRAVTSREGRCAVCSGGAFVSPPHPPPPEPSPVSGAWSD